MKEKENLIVKYQTDQDLNSEQTFHYSCEEGCRVDLIENKGLTEELVDELLETGIVSFKRNEIITVQLVKRLNIDCIPSELYDMLVDEFKRQHGEGIYDEWNITAHKIEGE